MKETEHILKGRDGEALARNYLIKKDFTILEQNWRSGRNEIDIIALRENLLHFVEVKTRHSLKFGYPEDGVSRKKFNCIRQCAVDYVHKSRWHRNIQFDILSVLILPGKVIEYFFIEDFYLY